MDIIVIFTYTSAIPMKETTIYKYRKAKISDCVPLEELIIQSSNKINNQFYSQEVLAAAIGNIWTVDKQLILDETYWLVENDKGIIVGCGGWSKRKLLFGSNTTNNCTPEELNPKIDPAKIRAFFVHPDHVRKGIGKKLLLICENEAKESGFKILELIATLAGEKLYKTCGFHKTKNIQIDLGNNICLLYTSPSPRDRG